MDYLCNWYGVADDGELIYLGQHAGEDTAYDEALDNDCHVVLTEAELKKLYRQIHDTLAHK